MLSYYSQLRSKEVIDIHSGLRLGFVCDLELDSCDGRILSLVTPGRPKLLGLLGREPDYVLPWGWIVRIGSDIILVECKKEPERRQRRRQFSF